MSQRARGRCSSTRSLPSSSLNSDNLDTDSDPLVDVLVPRFSACLFQHSITAWRFPLHISQSRLGGRASSSSACTVIAVRLAVLLHQRQVPFPAPLPAPEAATAASLPIPRTKSRVGGLVFSSVMERQGPLSPPSLLTAVVDAIVDGNELHAEALATWRRGLGAKFTVPDALLATRSEFKEMYYISVVGSFVTDHLASHLYNAIHSPKTASDPHVFCVLLCLERAILISFERATSTLLVSDSHAHHGRQYGQPFGTTVAVCPLSSLPFLVLWIRDLIYPELHFKPEKAQRFELSVLRPSCGDARDTKHKQCASERPVAFRDPDEGHATRHATRPATLFQNKATERNLHPLNAAEVESRQAEQRQRAKRIAEICRLC